MFIRKPIYLHRLVSAAGNGNAALDVGGRPEHGSVDVITSSIGSPTFSLQPQQSPAVEWDLPYDGGTGIAGPAVGDSVVGQLSKARGVIVAVSGGTPEAAGTIVLASKHGGKFQDNEKILMSSADSDILVNSASGGSESDNWANAGAAITTLTTTTVSGITMPRFRCKLNSISVADLTVLAA